MGIRLNHKFNYQIFLQNLRLLMISLEQDSPLERDLGIQTFSFVNLEKRKKKPIIF